MKTNCWGVFNADNTMIAEYVCSTRAQAFAKVKHFFPNGWAFVYIKKIGTRTI